MAALLEMCRLAVDLLKGAGFTAVSWSDGINGLVRISMHDKCLGKEINEGQMGWKIRRVNSFLLVVIFIIFM